MKIIKRPKIEGNEPKQYEVELGISERVSRAKGNPMYKFNLDAQQCGAVVLWTGELATKQVTRTVGERLGRLVPHC